MGFVVPLVSDHLVVPALNDSAPVRFCADSPRIFIFSIGANQNDNLFIQVARFAPEPPVAVVRAARELLAEVG